MNHFMIRFLEIGQTDSLFCEHFFKGYPEKYPFQRYFFEGDSREDPFQRYFFEGVVKENPFWGCFFEGGGKVVCFLNGLITEQFMNNEN